MFFVVLDDDTKVHFDDLPADVFAVAAQKAETAGVDSWASVFMAPARDLDAARHVIRAACEQVGVAYDEARYAKGSQVIGAFEPGEVDFPVHFEGATPDPKAAEPTTPG